MDEHSLYQGGQGSAIRAWGPGRAELGKGVSCPGWGLSVRPPVFLLPPHPPPPHEPSLGPHESFLNQTDAQLPLLESPSWTERYQ